MEVVSHVHLGLVALSCVGFLACAPSLLKEFRSLGPSLLFGLVLTTLLALALRAYLPPMAPFHEGAHGYGFLVAQSNLLHDVPVLYPLLLRLLGLEFDAVLSFNLVISTLVVPLVGLAAYEFLRDRRGAFFASLAAATLPVAVRIGPTECFFNTAAFFFFCSLWLGLLGVRKKSPLLLMVGGATVSLALIVRIMTGVLGPAWFVLMVVAIGRMPRRKEWVGLLLPFLVTIMHGAAILAAYEPSTHARLVSFVRQWDGLAPHSGPVPLAFSVLTCLGLFLMCTRKSAGDRRLGIMLTLVLLGLHIAGASAGPTPSIYRHLLVATLVWCIPIGGALSTPFSIGGDDSSSLRVRLQAAMMVLISFGLAAATLTSYGFVTHVYAENREYWFLQETLSTLRPECDLLTIPYQNSGLSGPVEWMTAVRRRAGRVEVGDCQVTFIDIHCTTDAFGEDLLPHVETRYGPIVEECVGTLRAHDWTPVRIEHAPGGSYMGYNVSSFRNPVPLIALVWDTEMEAEP